MRLKHFLSVFLTLLTLSVGQMWGTEATLNSVSANTTSTTGGSVSTTFNGVTCRVTKNGGSTSPGFYASKGIVRYYSGDEMTLSVASGNTITQIDFTMYSGSVGTASPGTLTGNQWKGSAQSVTFTGSATVKITSIAVTYSSGSNNPSVLVDPSSWNFGNVYASANASKTFSVSGTNLTSGQNLTLTAPTGYTVEPTSITVSSATLGATNVTVSKNKNTTGANNGNLSITGGGQASAKTVALTMNIVADPTYATLPFSFTSGSSAIANTDGMEQSGLGTDYGSGNPPLKFDNTGDYVLIRFNEAPKELTYDIKGNSFSGGTFKVQTSANGTDFTDLVSHTSLGNTENKKEDLASTVRYVKFIYTNKSSGNVGLGNIGISKLPTTATLTYDLNGKTLSSGTKPSDEPNITLNTAHTLPTSTLSATGYTFVGWNTNKNADSKLTTFTPTAATTYTMYAIWTPNTNTAYTVKHYKQNLAGTGYDLADTDNLTGTTDASVTPNRKSYTGFTAPVGQTVTILPNGSRVVTYNYTRNSYTLTWSTDGDALTGNYTSGSTKFGAAITAPNTPTKTGYVFDAWSSTPAATMPAAATTYTATWTCKVPEIGTDLSTAQVDYIKDVTATALTISATANGASLNYAWEKSANGTTGWSSVGSNSNEYIPSTEEEGDLYYRCIVTNAVAEGCSSATTTSQVAHIHVVAASVCLTPSFSPAEGTHVGSQNVTISSTDGATIYYTTDGTDPKVSGTRSTYSSAIPVDVTTTIRAYAEKAEMTASAEGSATITIKCAAPTFDPVEDTYTNAQNVTLATTYGDEIYYTTNGDDPATNGTKYTGPIAVNTTGTTIKAITKKENCANSELATATYTIACATPAFSPDGGTYTGTQNVTISSTNGATIYYTTDGTTPDNTKSVYSSAIPVSSNTTIKAIAVKDGLSQSAIGAATYSIKYTVTLNAGTGSVSADGWTESEGVWTKAQTAVGGSITLPDAALSSSLTTAGWSFAGWKTTSAETTQTETKPDFVNKTYTPTSDITLYAVYQKTTGAANYELVESNLGTAWAGDYLIAYSSSIFADGRVGGKDDTGAIGKQSTHVTPGDNLSANGKVVAGSWGDTYNVTLEEILDGETPTNTYVLKTKDNKYNYQTSNSNGLAVSANKETAAAYPISVTFNSSSDISLALGGGASGAIFHYNTSSLGSGGDVFRYYKNGGQAAIYLYKKGEGTKSYYSNPSDKVTLTYNVNGATAGPDTWTVDNIGIATSVTVVAKPETLAKTGYDFGGWNTKDDGTGTNYENGTDHQSFTINENTTLYAKWTKHNYTVAVASVDHTTITATPEGGSAIAESANALVAYGTVVTLGKTDDTHFTFDAWDVYATDDNTNKVSVTETAGVYTFTVPDFNVTVSATAPIEDHKNTVTWHVNYGTSETPNIYDGTPFSQLSAPEVADNAVPTCANKFMGWATAPISIDNATSSNVSWADETSVSDSNKDFYAVWATADAANTFNILSDANDFVSGADYIIASYDGEDDWKLKAENYNSTAYQQVATQATIGNDYEETEGKYIWTITSEGENTVSIYNATTEKYLAIIVNGNYTNLVLQDEKATLTKSDIAGATNDNPDHFEFGGNSKYVNFYDASHPYFNAHSQDGALYIFKRDVDYSNYVTNCCLPVENALTITNANQVATGNTLTLSSTGGNGGTVVWTVEAGTGTATISEGVLTGGNLGTVTLKAHQNANGNYCATDAEDMTVTIVAATVNVTGVSLDHTTAALLPGETVQLTATVAPDDATDKTIKSWVSSSDAATVNAGLVTAVAKGSSTVTVTTNDGDFTDDCEVTVYDLTIELQDETGATISAEGVTASATLGRNLSASAGETQYVFKGWKYAENGDGGLDAIANASNTSITLTGTPTGDVTIIAEFYKPVTIAWLVDGEDAAAGSQTLSVARGTLWSALTPAAEPAGNALGSCADAFVGWSNLNSELRGTGNAEPELLVRNSQFSSYDTEITEPITFRAVFATSAAGGTFDGTAGGQFYIYANVGGTYHYAKAAVTSNKLESTTSVAEAALFTFTKHETEANQFTISIGDNYYAKGSGNTDLKTQAAAYWWTLSTATYGSWHLESETNGRGFMYQDYQTVSQVTSYTRKFGCYSTNNADGDDYFDVEIAGAASYSNYVTVCCTPYTITVNGNDESENKTVSADATEICDGMTVNLSRNTSCTHYNFNKWVVKYTDGEGEQTINVSENENHSGSFTMPAYDVTVEGDWSPRNYTMTVNAPAAAKGSVSIVGGSVVSDYVRNVAYKSAVTLTVTENDPEHYYLRDWTIKNENTDETTTQTGNPLEIEMPGYPIAVTPNFADVAYAALTLGSAEGVYSLSATLANGDPIPDMSSIKSGTALKVTYALSGQNEFVGWTFSVNSVEKTAVGNTVTFNMPEEALNVSLNTRPYYLLDLSAEHGSITGVSINNEAQALAAQYIVHEGEVVALTAAPADDTYKFKEWKGADVNANGQFTVGTSDLDVAAVFELKDTYTLTLMALGREQEKIENILEGESIWSQISSKEAPEITGQLFLGWSMFEDDENYIFSESADLDIDDNYSLYAVYQAMTPCYVKVTSTSDIKNGKYLIVYETGNLAFNGSLETLDAASNTIDVEINTVGDYKTIEISNATTAAEFTIASMTGGYSIKSASGKYIDRTSGTSGGGFNTTESNPKAHTLSIDNDGNFADKASASTASYLKYNSSSGQYRFRYYTSGQQAIQLYKRAGIPNDAGETASIPTVTITTPVNVDEIYPDGKAGNIVIEDGGSININTEVEMKDLTVNDGGSVEVNAPLQADGIHLGVENTMTVNSTVNVPSFSISVQLGSTGQATNVTVSGSGNIAAPEGYVDMELSNDANPDQWHAFTVPFEVDALNGIYDAETGAPLQNEVNYAIMDYHGDIRAQGKYGWKKYRGTLKPGVFYLITVDGASKVLRFMKKAGSSYVAPNSMAMKYYGDNDPENTNNGWCGVGNQNMFGGYVPFKAQILNSTGTGYVSYVANETKFSACIPFFIQIESDDNLAVSATLPSSVAARRVAAKGINDIKVTFGNEKYSDKLYISANEDAKNAYEVGKDLVKMTMSNTPVIPQIFGKAYGNKLCMVYAPMSNDQAVYDLTLYAPANGEYTVAAPEVENADLYLTKDGAIIWNLTMSAYPISLNKGTTEGYGLLLKAKAPQTPTGVEQSEVSHQPSDIQKIIINDNVFILRGGQMYDVTGKAVK